jgi:hypothetical protein
MGVVMLETDVGSFIARFVQEHHPQATSLSNNPAASSWYGFNHHVQSSEETRFTHIEEALGLVANYVGLVINGPT